MSLTTCSLWCFLLELCRDIHNVYVKRMLKGWGGHWHFSAMLKSLLDTHLNKLAELTLSGGLSRSSNLSPVFSVCHLPSIILAPFPILSIPKLISDQVPLTERRVWERHCCLSWMSLSEDFSEISHSWDHTVGIETSSWLNQQTD